MASDDTITDCLDLVDPFSFFSNITYLPVFLLCFHTTLIHRADSLGRPIQQHLSCVVFLEPSQEICLLDIPEMVTYRHVFNCLSHAMMIRQN